MKAFILAAGYGTRLEPLTKAIPKPMVPIVNLPTMQHNIELLKKHGFKEIIANIHYYPEQIENYFRDGHAFGVNLSYSYEKELLGTAGGVKKMAKRAGKINQPFLVLSSDALTDVNLTRLVEFHKKKKALVTIALSKVRDVREFGIVVQNGDERIVGFQEKPKPEVAQSDLANTGLYVFDPEILKMIPDGFYDFGHQLFPKLVEIGAPIFGYRMVEYWSDVGGLDKYVASNYDAISGAVRIRVPGKKASGKTWVGEREKIDRSARFEGSVVIGDRCVIGKNVLIKDSVIGNKCEIDQGAVIIGSVLWSDNYVGIEARIENAIIGNFCYIGDEAKVGRGAVIANRSIVSFGTAVQPGAQLEPNTAI